MSGRNKYSKGYRVTRYQVTETGITGITSETCGNISVKLLMFYKFIVCFSLLIDTRVVIIESHLTLTLCLPEVKERDT